MTAQFPDEFVLNRTQYALEPNTGLFTPQPWGVYPQATCTACWRGFVAQYALANNRLHLAELRMSLGHFEGTTFVPEWGPPINGVAPVAPDSHLAVFNNIYPNLNLKLAFTGQLLLGRDFIRELYVHMGFAPAWKYREVFELTFEQGFLVNQRNISQAMEKFRQEHAQNQ